MKRLTRILLAASALLVAPTGIQAQCDVVPGTGCPGMPSPVCSAAPIGGQTITIDLANPMPVQGNLKILVVGYPDAGGPDLHFPLTCIPGPCGIGIDMSRPAVPVFVGPNPIQLAIPFGITGFTACMQWFEVMAPTNCLVVSQAMSLVVQ